MKNCAVGIFDSGIGGLALVNEINLLLPDENVIYLAADLQVTDLQKEKEAVTEYVSKSIDFLQKHEVKMILSACCEANTMYGVKSPDTMTEYSGIFLPASQAACGATKNNKIGIIGSPNVIKRGGYAKIIKNIKPGTLVIGTACPLLSNIVETGAVGKECTSFKNAAEKYLLQLKEEKVDTIILADGHYAMFKNIFAELLGESVTLISPYEETAKHVYGSLLESDLLSDRETSAQNAIYFTGRREQYHEIAPMFLNRANSAFRDINF